MIQSVALSVSAALWLADCAEPRTPAVAPSPAPQRARSFLVKHDSQVMVEQPAPHQGTGQTTAYRYFDELADAKLIFRKRALHPGAAIGMHVLKHDEVYYVLSGQGELQIGAGRYAVQPGTAIFMYEGTYIGIRQIGTDDLVLIIAYPPARARAGAEPDRARGSSEAF